MYFFFPKNLYLQGILMPSLKVKSMNDNCGEWVECMGVVSGCG